MWLESCGDVAVLRCFRGFAKSTILGVYNAWQYWDDPEYRILHQSESDGTAYKTSRHTQAVLRKHPWTQGMLPNKAGPIEQWWVNGASDERNASMYAKGILSNVTSARADECQNDDVEVPRNIQTPEAREKLRYRLGEQTHILVPGGRTIYIGTPHTHDSLYDEMERGGADCLTIPMFEKEHRIDDAKQRHYQLTFKPEFVFSSIGKTAKLLEEGADYRLTKTGIEFPVPPGGLVDCYSQNAWPERFDRAELLKRRRKTRTINEWDSQYQLHSKPISETRLDPARMSRYDLEPVIKTANGEAGMWLGRVRIASAALRWDPASGKLKSDVSALGLVLQDEAGRRYLHRILPLTGEIAEYDRDGLTITGGQVLQIAKTVREFSLGRITVETNGLGTFAPAVLKACFKQQKLTCGVRPLNSTQNKNKRILESFEPLLLARGMLWAHTSVMTGPLWDQMKDWKPEVTEQPDDYVDVAAGAMAETPERVNKSSDWISAGHPMDTWRQDAGTFEVELEG